MKKLMIIVAVLGAVLVLANEAGAINPQVSGETQMVAPGATSIVAFGPFSDSGGAPAAFIAWSGDGGEFWYRRAMGGILAGDYDSFPLNVPGSTTIPAWEHAIIGGNYYQYGEFTAGTDTLYIMALDGGIGR